MPRKGILSRVNGTPGYGEDHEPGVSMVMSWEEMPDGNWHYILILKLAMRAVLEEMNPPWLHEMVE